MLFIKYRFKFADGPDLWTYEDVSSMGGPDHEDMIREYLGEKAHKNYHDESEHFRGVEWEVVDKPPKEWLEDELKQYRRLVAAYLQKIDDYKELLR